MRRIYNKDYIRKLFFALRNRPLHIKPGHLYIFMASGKQPRPSYAIWTRNGITRFGQFNFDNETITEIAHDGPEITVGCSTLNFYGTVWYGRKYYSVHCFDDISVKDLDIEAIWYYYNLSNPKYLGNYFPPREEELAPIDYMS